MSAAITFMWVAESDAPPEKVMNAFKPYASRRLKRLGIDEPERKRWARHGSISGQGELMEV